MLEPYFDGVRESVIIIPKKNGKSTLVAALALYHLLVTPDADCIIVASARDQAQIILDQARKFIRKSPELASQMRVLQREIHLNDGGGRVRVLASDEDTADGVLPTLAIVDELHRHKTGDLYTVLRLAIGTTGGRMITISTAGASLATPLGEKRMKAYAMPGFVRDTERRRSSVRAPDGSFAFWEACLNPDDDPNDLELVKLVNPAPWKTPEMLAEEQGAVTPWQWLRFACGIWTEGEEPWLEPGLWDRLEDRHLKLIAGEDVFLGVDVGYSKDSTGIAIVAPRGEKLAVFARVMTPPDKGVLSIGEIEREILDIAAEYRVVGVAYDPFAFKRSAEILADEGLPMEPVPQSPERSAAFSENLYHWIEARDIIHNGDPVLRAHVMAGHTKMTERGWRLVKDPRHPRPIDALMALAMAVLLATEGNVGPAEFFSLSD